MEWLRIVLATLAAMAFIYFALIVIGNIAQGNEFPDWQWIQQVTPPSKNL